MTDKIDFKKTLDTYRAKQGRFQTVEVPDLQYLMVDGHGDPNTSPAFADAIEALYPVAYKLKFANQSAVSNLDVVPQRRQPLELWLGCGSESRSQPVTEGQLRCCSSWISSGAAPITIPSMTSNFAGVPRMKAGPTRTKTTSRSMRGSFVRCSHFAPVADSRSAPKAPACTACGMTASDMTAKPRRTDTITAIP